MRYSLKFKINFYILKKMRTIALFMIKNEQSIILRALESVYTFADDIVIMDTGSTDETVKLLKDSKFKFHLFEDLFEDFGKSRSKSFQYAKKVCLENEWKLNETFILVLDADMIFRPSQYFLNYLYDCKEFKGISIQQKNHYLKYNNIRFLRCDCDWICIGPTHEYWTCSNFKGATADPEICYIEDINDGGCKTDKTDRDIRLLENAEKNDRNTFYLAQSYLDKKDFEKAKQKYLERISFGGWKEEIYYSYYMLCKIAFHEKKYDDFEVYGLKAHFQNKNRRESLYFLTQKFREICQHKKALYYLTLMETIEKEPKDVLFSDFSCYEDKCIQYEKSILYYYVYPDKKILGLIECWSYLQKYYLSNCIYNVHSNMEFYLEKIEGQKYILELKQEGNYYPSTPSIIRKNGVLLGNVRYVNYVMNGSTNYTLLEEKVKTENYFIVLNNNFEIILKEKVQLHKIEKINHIEGLEDIRIYQKETDKNKLYFYANSFDFIDHVTVVQGVYDIRNIKIERVINTNKLEKNWFPWPENHDALIEGPWKLPQSDLFFRCLRGSTVSIKYKNCKYILFHNVIVKKDKRIYYNVLCKIEENDLKPKLSLPFKLSDEYIEYCLGIFIEDDFIYFSCSENDSKPFIYKVELKNIIFFNT